ncbi:MAG TPA: hypothetical protein PLP17_02645, partial [Oligoflexia bacterium]|nr:hypothetical protein [Oligoflexia bacterium]
QISVSELEKQLQLLDSSRQRIIDAFRRGYAQTQLAYETSGGEATPEMGDVFTRVPQVISELEGSRGALVAYLKQQSDELCADLQLTYEAGGAEAAGEAAVKLRRLTDFMCGQTRMLYERIDSGAVDADRGRQDLLEIFAQISSVTQALTLAHHGVCERSFTEDRETCCEALGHISQAIFNTAAFQAQTAAARARFDMNNVREVFSANRTDNVSAGAEQRSSVSSLRRIGTEMSEILERALIVLGVEDNAPGAEQKKSISLDECRILLADLQEKRIELDQARLEMEKQRGSADLRFVEQKKFTEDLRRSITELETALRQFCHLPEDFVADTKITLLQQPKFAGELRAADFTLSDPVLALRRLQLDQERRNLYEEKAEGRIGAEEFMLRETRLSSEIEALEQARQQDFSARLRGDLERYSQTYTALLDGFDRESVKKTILGDEYGAVPEKLSTQAQEKLAAYEELRRQAGELQSYLSQASEFADSDVVETIHSYRRDLRAGYELFKSKYGIDLCEGDSSARSSEDFARLQTEIEDLVAAIQERSRVVREVGKLQAAALDRLLESAKKNGEDSQGVVEPIKKERRRLAEIPSRADQIDIQAADIRREIAQRMRELRKLLTEDPEGNRTRIETLNEELNALAGTLKELPKELAELRARIGQSQKIALETVRRSSNKAFLLEAEGIIWAAALQIYSLDRSFARDYPEYVSRYETSLTYSWVPELSLYLFGKTPYTLTELSFYYAYAQRPGTLFGESPPGGPLFSRDGGADEAKSSALLEDIRIRPFLEEVFAHPQSDQERQKAEQVIRRLEKLFARRVWTGPDGRISVIEELDNMLADFLLAKELREEGQIV